MTFPSLAVIALIVVAGLILLYLVARRVKPFGQSLAFVCAVAGRLLVTLSYHMEKAAASCKRACLASLKSISATGEWTILDIAKRLVDFGLGALILLGETVQVMQILPTLFATVSPVTLPPIAEYSSAALFICCAALFGEILLECWGKIRGVGLFHNMGKPSRWIVGALSLLLLVFTILVNGYFYVYRAAVLAHADTTGMSLYILGGLGLEVSAVSPFALLAVIEGSSSVVALLMWLAEKTCETVHAAATFIPDFLDNLALHLSQGEIGVWGSQIERDPHQFPSFPASRQVIPGQNTTTALAHLPATTAASALGNDAIVAVTTTITEVSMADLEKAASFVFVCTPRLFEHVRQKIDELHATGSILSSAFLALPVNHIDTAIPGVVDLSPTYQERHAVMVHSETEGQAIRTLLTGVGSRLVETHQHTKGFPAPLWFCIDCHYLVDAIEMLESIKRRLPLHPLVVVTEVESLDAQDKIVQVGVSDLQSLADEDIVATVIVTDPHSPFASLYGLDTQRLFEAHDLVSLTIAHTHSLHNSPFSTELKKLHSLSPFTTIASASEAVAIGKLPARWSWLPGVKNQAGTGSYSDILAQTRAAVDRVMTDANTCMFPCQVEPHVPSLVVVTEPIRLDDARFAACVRDNSLSVSAKYPYASCLTTRGNGSRYPHDTGSRFLVQAARLLPLQPASLLRLHEDTSKSVKVTQLYPVTSLERASENGNVPVQEQKQDGKPTKAGATTRRKKAAAPSRRVGRKSTKQAK